jgi:c-di-GMP-related signal transduction protein
MFESPLNKMKDSDVLTGLVQVINTLLPMAADNPGLFDKINMDKAVEMALESVRW